MIPNMIGTEIKDHAKNLPNAPRTNITSTVSIWELWDGG